MQKSIVLLFKFFSLIKFQSVKPIDWLISYVVFYVNGVQFSSFNNKSWPIVNVSRGGKCIIGKGFRSNNRVMSNPIGRFNRCSLIVGNEGTLIIGNNVGMSSTAIVCRHHIEIGDNVNLGGNVVIYDTDFHSLNSESRLNYKIDQIETKIAAVKIGKSAFIGGHSTILKGVEIGENSIIGACSVVTRNVPANEIWAGNPAKKIRSINLKE